MTQTLREECDDWTIIAEGEFVVVSCGGWPDGDWGAAGGAAGDSRPVRVAGILPMP